MSVSEFTAPKRLSLTLDPGLVLERLILQRLAGLKRKRSQDWLRSLLVQGFLAEGRWIRSDLRENREHWVPGETPVPATAFAGWLEREQPKHRPDAERIPVSAQAAVLVPTTESEPKPFAHLRKVIG